MKDHYNDIIKKTMERNIPFIVHWELTHRCNMACSHCYCVRRDDKKELTTEEIMSVIDELAALQSLYITFSGGEILTRKDFFTIARYSRSKGFALRLLTNGTFISSEMADEIKQLNPLSVEMSVYAADPEIHDSITGTKGSFKKTMRAFQLLGQRGVKRVVKSLLMNQNADQLGALTKLSHELDSDFVYDMTVVPKDDGSRDTLRYRLDTDGMTKIFREDDRAASFEPLESVNDDTFMCTAGLNNLLISPYGEVYPCVGWKQDAGNVREQSIEQIMQSGHFQRIRSIKFDELHTCRSCDKAPYCRRCPGLAVSEDEDYLGPSSAACMLAKALKNTARGTCLEV
ncbi:MAG: radical SAM protein [Nitrospiraceae bacterium]|nr:MAG: radical SAM protein [Nitrospiraceae bacterium]